MRKKKNFCVLAIAIGFLSFGSIAAAADEEQYGDLGSWTASDGTVWEYVEIDDDEAAIYGVSNALVELEMPSYVYDENGNGRKVTEAIGVGIDDDEAVIYYDDCSLSYTGRVKGYEPYSISFPDTVRYIGKRAFGSWWDGDSDEDLDEGSGEDSDENPDEGSDEDSDEDPDEGSEYTWGHWSFLGEVVLPQNPTLVIGERAFSGSLNLQKVTFRAEIMKAQPADIGALAFGNCPKLTEFTFPQGSTVAGSALSNCSNLKQIINVPGETHLYMGETSKSSLEKIIYAEGAEEIGGVSFEQKIGDTHHYNAVNNTLKEIILPAGVKKITSSAFKNCAALTSINLPEGLTGIGGSAFENCSMLNSFTTLPSTLEEIGSCAFMGCKNLHLSVKYPAGDTMCAYEFKDSGITDISFHNRMQLIYSGSFMGCKDLKSIQVDPGHHTFYSIDGVLYSKSRRRDEDGKVVEELGGIMIYPAGKSYAGSYTIPANAEYLDIAAFDSCKFTEIRIPVTVKAILSGLMASLTQDKVWYCSFDNMETKCPLYVVENSSADLDITWRYGSRVKYMPGNPVKITYEMNGGTNHAGNPKTFVGGDVIQLNNPTRKGYKFAGWKIDDKNSTAKGRWDDAGWWVDEYEGEKGWKYVPARDELIRGVTFVAEWKAEKTDSSTGNGSIQGYKLNADGTAEYKKTASSDSKTTVTVPDKVKAGGKTYKVTKISANAFAKCKKLKSVTIGKNIKEIGNKAFSGCKKLQKITIKSKQLKKVGAKAFKGIHKKAKIKVPKAKLKAYKKLLKGKGQAKSVKITK